MPRSFLITNRRYRASSPRSGDVSDDVGDDVSCSPTSSVSSSWSRDEGSPGTRHYSVCFSSRYLQAVLEIPARYIALHHIRVTRSSNSADGPRDGMCQSKSCQLLHNGLGTTCRPTTNPKEVEVMELEGYSQPS